MASGSPEEVSHILSQLSLARARGLGHHQRALLPTSLILQISRLAEWCRGVSYNKARSVMTPAASPAHMLEAFVHGAAALYEELAVPVPTTGPDISAAAQDAGQTQQSPEWVPPSTHPWPGAWGGHSDRWDSWNSPAQRSGW